jgi:hypothetical protein
MRRNIEELTADAGPEEYLRQALAGVVPSQRRWEQRASSVSPFQSAIWTTTLTLRDWDLWGPLVICLSLAIILSIDVSCFRGPYA